VWPARLGFQGSAGRSSLKSSPGHSEGYRIGILS
jgi:hypothetical protein